MTLKTKLSLGVSALLNNALDLGVPSSPLDYAKSVVLATGTGAGQADRVWHDTRTLAAATSSSRA